MRVASGICRILDRLVGRRMGRTRRKEDLKDFEECWLRTGMAARDARGHVRATCLDSKIAATRTQSSSARTRVIYTDGSMAKGKAAKAGYGIAEYTVSVTGREIFERARCGKVVTARAHKMYKGATKHSNNAAEMTALLACDTRGRRGNRHRGLPSG